MAVIHGSDIRRFAYMEAPGPDKHLHDFPAFTPEGEFLVWHFSFFVAATAWPKPWSPAGSAPLTLETRSRTDAVFGP